MLLSAAGSHPGDLHKLWRTRTPNGYHLEYGYSTMGYEIPGALGAKLADPSREVFVFLGDGTYLMMPSEIVTAVQEHIKIIIVLVDNKGFASIGGLSRSLGMGGFGTSYRERSKKSGQLDGELLGVDYVASVRSLGAHAIKAESLKEFRVALEEAKRADRVTVVVVESQPGVGVPGYESWWDVAVAEVSQLESVRQAHAQYIEARKKRAPPPGNLHWDLTRGCDGTLPRDSSPPIVVYRRRPMRKFMVGNAPCSWGTLEFEGTGGEPIPFGRMLDELAETGYTGTELGDWGYMPIDPQALSGELERRGLVMLGAFVPVALKDPAALPEGIAVAVKTARLLAAVATSPRPYLVLADNNGTVLNRTQRAGRITARTA